MSVVTSVAFSPSSPSLSTCTFGAVLLLAGVLLAGCAGTRPPADPEPPAVPVALAVLPAHDAATVAVAPLPRADLPPDSLTLRPRKRRAFFERLRELPVRLLGTGRASYYGRRFAGRRTASGERFRPEQLTAAHRTLPFGSRVRVTNLDNGKSVVVRINDRGPFAHRRVIDLSRAAAREIGMLASGTAPVQLELLTLD